MYYITFQRFKNYCLRNRRKLKGCSYGLSKNVAIDINIKVQIPYPFTYTVCPGTNDPPEKIFYIFLHQKMRFTPVINYYDTLG